jgi:hypothetical protein
MSAWVTLRLGFEVVVMTILKQMQTWFCKIICVTTTGVKLCMGLTCSS